MFLWGGVIKNVKITRCSISLLDISHNFAAHLYISKKSELHLLD